MTWLLGKKRVIETFVYGSLTYLVCVYIDLHHSYQDI